MSLKVYKGPSAPFRRDGNSDFTSAEGLDLIRANVAQVLATAEGSLPWRPRFGSKLYKLLHAPALSSTQYVAQYFASQALERWLPSVRVKRFSATLRDGALIITLDYRVVNNGSQGPVVTGQAITIQP